MSLRRGVAFKVVLRLVRREETSERSNAFKEQDTEGAVDKPDDEDHPADSALEIVGPRTVTDAISPRKESESLSLPSHVVQRCCMAQTGRANPNHQDAQPADTMQGTQRRKLALIPGADAGRRHL